MAEIEVGNLVAKISIDDSGLQKSTAEINRQMKLVQSEFQRASAGVKNFGSTEEELRTKTDLLTKQLGLQQQQVNKINAEFQKSAQEKGEDAVATQKLATQLNKAQAEYNRLDSELKQTTADMARQAAEMQRQNSAWTKLSETLNQAGDKMKSIGNSMTDAGKSLSMKVTAPIVAVGTAASKMSIDFESAFAGVRKTIDATEKEYAVLKQQIRDMAKTIPQSANEIAKVAETAGQLGIKKEAIMGFTRTMVDLGVATNMTSDEAATALARLANIVQMPQSQFDRLGATVVDLGNNLATTEGEIVAMGLRIAGAGHQIGLTEAQILGFAGALSSVGIEAEAGGSAISRVMIEIANAVMSGGDQLNMFAQVAGMSSAQFQQAFRDDAANAILSFIEGLGRMQNSGQNTFAVLDKLSLSEIRVRDSLLRASGAGDLFRESIELGSKAWQDNTALTNEANERYKTTASQLQIMKNKLIDVGITLGDALIPALMKALDAMEPFFDMLKRGAEWFAGLDQQMQTTIIAIVGITAAIGPALIVMGKLVTSVGAIVKVFGSVAGSISKAGGAMALLTNPVGQIAAAVAAAAVVTAALYANWERLMNLAAPLRVAILSLLAPFTAIVAAIKGLQSILGASVPAVQSFGTESKSAMEKSSGSFQRFRSESETALKETAKTAKTEGVNIGENVASGVKKGTKKAKDTAADDMREMVDKMKETVNKSAETINKLGDAIVTAIKKQYDEAEKVQTKALDKQIESEKKASDERLKIYDREYTEKLKLVDEETYNAVKALQDQIDGIDKQTDAEDKATKEQEHRQKVGELNKQLAAAETAEERERIQRELSKTIADYERQMVLEQRRAKKDDLKQQIDAAKEAGNARKEQLKKDLENQKEEEKNRIQVVQESLNEEKNKVKAHFEELNKEENLRAEARKLIVTKNNDEIVKLLSTYNPKWQDAGQSFADAFKNGLNSSKQGIAAAVSEAVNIAPVIQKQVAELDALEKKLKKLEKKRSASGGSGGGAIPGIPSINTGDIGAGFDDITKKANELADSLNTGLTPAMDGVGDAAAKGTNVAVDAFLGLKNKATVELNGLYWSGKEVTEKTAESIADTYFAMGDEITARLQEDHTQQLTEMQSFLSSSKVLTEKEKAEALQNLKTSQEKEAKELETGKKRIATILLNAMNENRGITQKEYQEITKIQETMTNTGIRVLSNGAQEQKVIFEKLKNEASDLSTQQAAEVVKNSIKQRDESIKTAENQYSSVVGQIIKQRDEMGTITKEQADKLILEAQRQRDESIARAKDMHTNVVTEAQKQASEHVNKVDWETGEIKSKWRVLVDDVKGKLIQMAVNMTRAWNEMWEACKEWMGKIKTVVVDMWNEIIEWLSNLPARMWEMGKNIMQGLADGIKNTANSVWEAAKDAANSISDTVSDALDMHSPSRVMMQLGEYTGEGLAIGMRKSLGDITKQSAAMAAAAIPGMENVSMPGRSGARGTISDEQSFNFEGMFSGANFFVRTDDDIRAVARELHGLQQSAVRSTGVRGS
ncbi:phage tail tape measure protein [Paenibacillus apiarius]|uniref:phage tail tape measure protein n=1 Tax=Paenibacillus apiarius TaxID=46240 RepID=UPI003B3B1976